jgi:hypothetical protein
VAGNVIRDIVHEGVKGRKEERGRGREGTKRERDRKKEKKEGTKRETERKRKRRGGRRLFSAKSSNYHLRSCKVT